MKTSKITFLNAAILAGGVVWTAIAFTFSALGQDKKEVRLVDLEPAEAEYGMNENSPKEWNLAKGPHTIDIGLTYGGSQQGRYVKLWTAGATKIVKDVPPNASLPEGQTYDSKMEDVFAVAGEFVTGVGLWCRSNCQYHWVEYNIPEGAKSFSGSIMITDDAAGVNKYPVPKNQEAFFKVFIDGEEKFSQKYQRFAVQQGSGQTLFDVSVDIPAGAKVIRFFLSSTACQYNMNNEIVINEGKFTF